MKSAPIPVDDDARLRALDEHEILDTEADPRFDAIARLVAMILEVPIALISIVDRDRQWFKARHGLAATESPRDISFCGHVVADTLPLAVADTLADARFLDNPVVTGESHVRFYAGYPLRTVDGHVLGTLCAVDRAPRILSPYQREALELLASHSVADAREAKPSGFKRSDPASQRCRRDDSRPVQRRARRPNLDRTSTDPRWRATRADGTDFPDAEHPSMMTLRTGVPQSNVEMRIHARDGALRWLSINSRELRTSSWLAICKAVRPTSAEWSCTRPSRQLIPRSRNGSYFSVVT